MAEQLIRDGYADSNGDGIPDILEQFQNDNAFGPHKANWNIRRRLTIGVILSSYGVCLIISAVWLYMVIFTKEDLQPNLMNFGTTIFWAMLVTATTTMGIYTGVSQMDTQSYRKGMVDVIRAVPQPAQPKRGQGGGGGYPRQQEPYYYEPSVYSEPEPEPPVPSPAVRPPTPVGRPSGPPQQVDPNVVL